MQDFLNNKQLMMKKIFFTLCFITAITELNACDICGCGVGGNYIGILPDFNQKIAGLRYRYSALHSHVGTGGGATYLTTKEIFHTAEFWGGWNIRKKWRLMLSIPLILAEKTNQGTTKTKNGLGDISVSGFYNIINKKNVVGESRLLVQHLWVGAGVKLPTGKYNGNDKSNGTQNTNLFQLGTGSTDFMLNAMYDIRLQDAGINITGSYKINTANKDAYRYGNKFSLNSQLYHKFSLGNSTNISPNAGVLVESSQKDLEKKMETDASGGNIIMGTMGAEYIHKKFMMGFNWQTPLHQYLANGIVQANNKAMLHIGIAF